MTHSSQYSKVIVSLAKEDTYVQDIYSSNYPYPSVLQASKANPNRINLYRSNNKA